MFPPLSALDSLKLWFSFFLNPQMLAINSIYEGLLILRALLGIILYFIFSLSFFFFVVAFGGLDIKSCPTLVTPGTVALQAPLSMGFSRQQD